MYTVSIAVFTHAEKGSQRSSGTSNRSSSCTVSNRRASGHEARKPSSTWIIASFRRSAAVPWIGVLRAMRSAWLRSRDRATGR